MDQVELFGGPLDGAQRAPAPTAPDMVIPALYRCCVGHPPRTEYHRYLPDPDRPARWTYAGSTRPGPPGDHPASVSG